MCALEAQVRWQLEEDNKTETVVSSRVSSAILADQQDHTTQPIMHAVVDGNS